MWGSLLLFSSALCSCYGNSNNNVLEGLLSHRSFLDFSPLERKHQELSGESAPLAMKFMSKQFFYAFNMFV